MWRKFNILKGKWEFWFGNFLFFCPIWKTLTLKRPGRREHNYPMETTHTSSYLTLSHVHTHQATEFGIFSHCFSSQRKWLKRPGMLLYGFELFVKVFVVVVFYYTSLPLCHSFLTFIICVNLEASMFKDPKMWGVGGEGRKATTD